MIPTVCAVFFTTIEKKNLTRWTMNKNTLAMYLVKNGPKMRGFGSLISMKPSHMIAIKLTDGMIQSTSSWFLYFFLYGLCFSATRFLIVSIDWHLFGHSINIPFSDIPKFATKFYPSYCVTGIRNGTIAKSTIY